MQVHSQLLVTLPCLSISIMMEHPTTSTVDLMPTLRIQKRKTADGSKSHQHLKVMKAAFMAGHR
jgi:hypothetical protein